MSFVGDWFISLFEGIAYVISRIIEGITQFINMLRQEILTIMHEIKQTIGEWLSSWVGGVAALLIVLLVYVVGPIAVGILEDVGIIGMLESMKEIMEKVGEAILVTIHWRELMLISDIASFIWDDYKNLINKLYNAMGSLSEELGYETGFIILAIRNARNVIRQAGILVGVPKEYIELEGMDATAQALQEVNDHFHYYAAHPEHFLEHLDDNVIYPYEDTASGTQGEFLAEIGEALQTARDTVDNLNNLKEATDKLVEDLPDEINSRINEWYLPVAKQWDNFYVNEYTARINTVDNIINRIDEYNAELKANQDKLKVISTKPMSYLWNLRYVDEAVFNVQIRLMGCLAWQGLQQVIDDNKKPGYEIGSVVASIIDSIKSFKPTPFFLTFEPETAGLENVKKIGAGKSWQVGDY